MFRFWALVLVCAASVAAQQKDLELFLLIGQSNMAGRGVVEARDKQPIDGVFVFTKEMTWTPAVDPLHFDKPEIAGVGIGRSFASALKVLRPGAKIGLIPAAFGGSALDEWKPGANHYGNAVARAKKAMESGKLRGILWHQGEADSGTTRLSSNYRQRWIRVFESLRADLNAPDVPVVVGQLGEFYSARQGGKGVYADVVNEQLATLVVAAPNVGFASSAGLKHKGDVVHFDAPSLREFGVRYALAYLALDATWRQ
ncbi:MAG: sialate O-acetylesterase [Acidobacteria bacterium]|nr:sialate O-acetylesterase [Acidobacteriota bacterium]